MNKEKFVKGYLEKLIEKDKDIHKYFNGAEDKQEIFLRETLRKSLEHSYDTYAKEYFQEKGLGSYVSTFLRYTGAGLDVAGTYLFWTMGGAGFGLKGLGLGGKSLADFMDNRHFAKHAKKHKLGERILDDVKLSAELIAERAAAYTPLTFGVAEVADLLRGKNKYDKKIKARTVQYAKKSFLDYIRRVNDEKEGLEREPTIVSLDNFKNREYLDREELKEAA